MIGDVSSLRWFSSAFLKKVDNFCRDNSLKETLNKMGIGMDSENESQLKNRKRPLLLS